MQTQIFDLRYNDWTTLTNQMVPLLRGFSGALLLTLTFFSIFRTEIVHWYGIQKIQ